MSSNEEDNAANNSLSDTQPSVPEITEGIDKLDISADLNETKESGYGSLQPTPQSQTQTERVPRRPADSAQVPQTDKATPQESLIRIFTDWLGWMDCCRKFIKKEWLEEKMKILDNLLEKADEIWNDGLLGFSKKECSLTTKDSLYSKIDSLEQLCNEINKQKLILKSDQFQNPNINDFLEQYKILVDSCERQKSEAHSDLIVFEACKTNFALIKADMDIISSKVKELEVNVKKCDSCIDQLFTNSDVNRTLVESLKKKAEQIQENNKTLLKLADFNQSVSIINQMKKGIPIYRHMLWNINGLSEKDTNVARGRKSAKEKLENLKKFIDLYEVDVVTLTEMRITEFEKFQEVFRKAFDEDKFGIIFDKDSLIFDKEKTKETQLETKEAKLVVIYRKQKGDQEKPENCSSWRINKSEEDQPDDRILRYEYKGVLYFAVHLNAHKQGALGDKAKNTKQKLIEGEINAHEQVIFYGDPNLQDVFESLKAKKDRKKQNENQGYEAVFDKLRLVKQWIEKTTNTMKDTKTRPDAVVTRLDEQGQPRGVQLLSAPFVEERCMYRNGGSMSPHNPIFFNVLPVPGYFQKAYDEILFSLEEEPECSSQDGTMDRSAKDDALSKKTATKKKKDSDAPSTSE